MLTRAELLLLADWCRARRMTCIPARAADGAEGAAALLLQRPGREADAMLLVVEARERRLLDGAGLQLATASGLPALLDAVDGGVADLPAAPNLPAAPGVPSAPERSGAWLRSAA